MARASEPRAAGHPACVRRRGQAARRRLLAAFGACAALAPFLAHGSPAAAGPVGVGLRPGQVDLADPESRSYFKPTVAPGAIWRDEVVVTNASDQALDLVVSAVDGLTAPTSGAVYANRQDPVARAGLWLRPDVDRLALAPRGEARVGITVSVPSDAVPGDHLAGLAVEDAQPRHGDGGFAVTQIVRSVIGVLVRVPGAAAPSIVIDDVALRPPPTSLDPPWLAITVRNRGLALGKGPLSVVLERTVEPPERLDRHLDTILPGDAIVMLVPWPGGTTAGDVTVVVRIEVEGVVVERRQVVRVGDATVTGAPSSSTPSALAPDAPVTAARRDGASPSGLARAFDAFVERATAAAKAAAPVVTIPLPLVLALALFAFAQSRIDRDDPKLALAPTRPEPPLEFRERARPDSGARP